MYTLDELQQKIHRIYQGDVEYPVDGEEDYTLRTGFINDAINDWAYNQGISWKELFINLSDAPVSVGGDKTSSTSTTKYEAPTDFVFISSWIKITNSNNTSYYYEFCPPDDVMRRLKTDSSLKFFYITGVPGSYVININSPISGTIEYSYYKRATHLVNTTDVIEMSKPYFAIYKTVSQLYELDNRNDMVSKYTQLAKNLMDEMIIDNETVPINTSYRLKDLDYEVGGAVIGQ